MFYRLNVIRIHIPGWLSAVKISPAWPTLLQRAGVSWAWAKVLHKDTEKYLAAQGWPGNVRQLENTCRWLTVMASGREVLVDDLPPELKRPVPPRA